MLFFFGIILIAIGIGVGMAAQRRNHYKKYKNGYETYGNKVKDNVISSFGGCLASIFVFAGIIMICLAIAGLRL